jgi:hypothetical protein
MSTRRSFPVWMKAPQVRDDDLPENYRGLDRRRRPLTGLTSSLVHLCGAALLALSTFQPAASAEAQAPSQASPNDRLEPGLQGQTIPNDLKTKILPEPYSKGVHVIGHSDILKRDSNVQLAWIDSCAYVSSMAPPNVNMLFGSSKANYRETAGVAVIDVSDPRAPKEVQLLRDRGAIDAAETIHAVKFFDRKVLVAGAYGGGKPGSSPDNAAWLDIYDASTCTKPMLMAEFKWPENVHTITISPNGRRVYGTVIDPFVGRGGLYVLDISDMSHPHLIGKFGATRPDGTTYEFAVHEISISPDEHRIYAGVIASKGTDLNQNIKTSTIPTAEALGPDAGGIYILDNSDIVDGKPDPKMHLIGTIPHAGWHSVMLANIDGRPYLVGAGELGPCPGAWPKITDIADEIHPYIVGEFKLQMNVKKNCPPPQEAEIQNKGIIGAPGTATSHYNDVDSETNTRLGLFNFMWAGLRIADLRNPKIPVEVGYFKPGDACTGHVRYLPNSGDIWFTCAASGFWVIEISSKLRSSLGLPPAHLQMKEH